MSERLVLQLNSDPPPATAKGELRPATKDDMPLVKEWIKNFYVEALNIETPELTASAPASVSEDEIKLYLWWGDKNRPVAMGALHQFTRLNLIYTPPQHRKNGYGSAIITALAIIAIIKGNTPILHADETNADAVKLYKSIGFTEV